MSESGQNDQNNQISEYSVEHVEPSGHQSRGDTVVVEEPMEIRVVFGSLEQRSMRSLSVTMRTPGNDSELAAGFLFTEGILNSCEQIQSMTARGVDPQGKETGNIVRVDLMPEVPIDFKRLQRNFFTTSSCGVCGKASLEALHVSGLRPITSDQVQISAEMIYQLPQMLRSGQPTFAQTGGLHAAAVADAAGNLVAVREDVGRHNAVDKLVGRFFLDAQTPLNQYIMVISGRASFEILQKALVAGVPMIVAVGAPSSLAVDVAREYGMTLVGFASASRFNIYAGGQRITTPNH